jgi:leader peptidase (prepilin peptidase)/N-methyltransferase
VEIALAVLAGLLIGSFLNVCIFRLPRDLSVASPARSFCPGCEKTISWYDNIPLLSFALLGGKCRHCTERIPLRYPIVELATGIAFGLCVGLFGVTPQALKFCLFSAIMIDLIATDLEVRILPDEFTLGGTVLGLVLSWFVLLPTDAALILYYYADMQPDPRVSSLTESALGAVIPSGLLWLVAWAFEKIRHKEGMGFGDIKMMALIGAFFGLRPALFCLVLASVSSSVTGPIFAIIAKRKLVARLARSRGLRRAMAAVVFRFELPLGSYLGAAALIVAFWMRT